IPADEIADADLHRPSGVPARPRRGPAPRDGSSSAAWRAEVAIREAELLRRLAAGAGAERGRHESGARGRDRRRLAAVRPPVYGGDEEAGRGAPARHAGGIVTHDRLLHRLLLRGRVALPPLDPAPRAAPARRVDPLLAAAAPVA